MYINNRQLGLWSLTNVIPSKKNPSVSCILEVIKLSTASIADIRCISTLGTFSE